MKRFILPVVLFSVAITASAAEIKLAPGTWTGTARVILVVDAAGNQTVTLDPTGTVTITGGGGVVPPPVVVPPVVPPVVVGTLAEVVKAATAAVPEYEGKVMDRRSMAWGMGFTQGVIATVPVDAGRKLVREFCDSAVGDGDMPRWTAWWAAVDAKLNTMNLTPQSYSAAVGEIVTALTADLPATNFAPLTDSGHETYGLSAEFIELLKKILIPLLMRLIEEYFNR